MPPMLKLAPVAVMAALALAACKQETIVAGDNDDMKNEVAAAPPVELPPSIKSDKIYRCKDNSVVYVAFLDDDKTANFRSEKGASPIQLKAAEAGQAFVADGYSLTGSGSTVTLERPGKGSQACKA